MFQMAKQFDIPRSAYEMETELGRLMAESENYNEEAKELAAELDALNKMDIFEESIFDDDMEKALIQLRGAVCRRCFTATHGA